MIRARQIVMRLRRVDAACAPRTAANSRIAPFGVALVEPQLAQLLMRFVVHRIDVIQAVQHGGGFLLAARFFQQLGQHA